MRDVDEGDALLAKLAHHLEELLHLLRHKRRSGLIKNDDLGVVRDSFGDLDHLALGHRHGAHGLGEVNGHAQAAEQVVGLLAHTRLVDDAHLVDGITTEEQVVHDVALQALVELLVHHRDTVFQRVLRSGEADLATVERDGALVFLIGAEQALHHGRLAGAVLAHQAHDATAAQIEVDVIQNAVAPERLAHPLDGEDDILL